MAYSRLSKNTGPTASADTFATFVSEEVYHDISLEGTQRSHHERPPPLGRMWGRFKRVTSLLATGYATSDSRKKYEKTENWHHFHRTMITKLENIGVVSGLLISSSANLLSSGDLRRMTYVATVASMLCSLLSIIFGLLCLWALVGVHPIRLKSFVETRGAVFYYLYATPSLFGGAAALTFFVAIGAWTWLDHELDQYGVGGRVFSLLCSTALVANASICFVLGGSTWTPTLPDEEMRPVKRYGHEESVESTL